MMDIKNKINLPKDVLGLYCLSCKNDLEIDSLGNYLVNFVLLE